MAHGGGAPCSSVLQHLHLPAPAPAPAPVTCTGPVLPSALPCTLYSPGSTQVGEYLNRYLGTFP